VIDLYRAAPHIRLHRDKVIVIKVGGGSLGSAHAREALARQISLVHDLGSHVVVVHGGGPQTDELQRLLGDEPEMVDGRRVTTEAALRALRMATGGELNGLFVGSLRALGTPAVGLSAASGILTASRRPPLATTRGPVDFGLVGDLERVDVSTLVAVLDAGSVPVVCPPAADEKGGALNVNADLAAAAIAVEMESAKLVLMTGTPGILARHDDPGSLLSAITLSELDALEDEGGLAKGMLVKAAAIRKAIRGGVGRVHVVSGSDPDALLLELYTNHGAGTLVTLEPEVAPILTC
jgi:acetylglutamate kinase